MLRIGLIGCGRVGLGFIRSLKGVRVVGVDDRNPARLRRAERLFQCRGKGIEAMVKKADVILIATNDDQIRKVARAVRRRGFDRTLIHFSGLLPSRILGPNRASIHPLGSFARPVRMNRTPFVIEGDRKGKEVAIRLVSSITDQILTIRPGDKPYYHLACVFVSNLLIGLYAMAQDIIKTKGIDLLPLLESTVANLKRLGPKRALTGPLIRGDIRTLLEHRRLLKGLNRDFEVVYLALSRQLIRDLLMDDDNLARAELTRFLEP